LRCSWQENSDKINGVERLLADTEKKIAEEMELRLNKQGRACKDLVERQAEVMKACDQAKTLGERANSALKKLTHEHECQKQLDLNSLSGMRDSMSGLVEKLSVVDQDVQELAQKSKSIDREVQHLKTWTDQLNGIEELHEEQSQSIALIKEQTGRFDDVEIQLKELRREADSHRHQQNAELNSLEQRIDKNISDTVRWLDTQKAHVDIISSTGSRLQDLERHQCRFSDFVEHTEEELRSIASWQQEAGKALEAHGNDIVAARASLSQTEQNIQGSSVLLQGLRSEFNSERDTLGKLAARVDQCYKYFSGLGKGLQDTQRQILSAENGMLPPKMGGMLLPSIPVAPRTPRGNSTPRGNVTPRKGGNTLVAA
jgi:chromosome segregation ATPase